MPNARFAFTVCALFLASDSRFMHLFQGALDILRHPLSSRFALHGLRTFDFLQ